MNRQQSEPVARSPVTARALEFLQRVIDATPPSGRIPGVRSLAKASGISHVTILKALGILRLQGKVTSAVGEGTTVVPGRKADVQARPELPAVVEREPKWQSLCKLIERDVLIGDLPAHRPLPSIKTLRQRYSVSYWTLSKTLDHLVSEGFLIACKSTYRVIAPRIGQSANMGDRLSGDRSRASQRIALIGFGTQTGRHQLDDLAFRYRSFTTALERECFLSNLRLDVVSHDADDHIPDLENEKGEWRYSSQTSPYQGFLVLDALLADPSRFLQHVMMLGKPISMLIQGPADRLALPSSRVPTKLFSVGFSQAPGWEVGAYLIRLGHRKVAFISPYHHPGGSSWSVNRLSGLRRAFSSAGISGGVVAFTKSEFSSGWDYLKAAVARPDFKSPVPASGNLSRMLVSHVRQLKKDYEAVLRDYEILRYFVPFFEQALAEPGITAWVCANDYIALFALEFLSLKKVRVPDRISLIGFDDMPQGLENRLSTYHFDMETAARNMLMHACNPGFRPLNRRPGPVEIGGMIIERGTTGHPDGLG